MDLSSATSHLCLFTREIWYREEEDISPNTDRETDACACVLVLEHRGYVCVCSWKAQTPLRLTHSNDIIRAVSTSAPYKLWLWYGRHRKFDKHPYLIYLIQSLSIRGLVFSHRYPTLDNTKCWILPTPLSAALTRAVSAGHSETSQ